MKKLTEAVDTPVMSIAEEVVTVAKRSVRKGRVRIRTVTETLNQLVKADLLSKKVTVVRVPINRQIETVPQVRVEGSVTIIPVYEEVLFIEKRLMLKEEIHLHEQTKTEHFETAVKIRRQRAVVDPRATQTRKPRSARNDN